MTPLKAVAAFTLGFGLLVGTGIALATTDFANAPSRDGYGVPAGSATSTHSDRPADVSQGEGGRVAWR